MTQAQIESQPQNLPNNQERQKVILDAFKKDLSELKTLVLDQTPNANQLDVQKIRTRLAQSLEVWKQQFWSIFINWTIDWIIQRLNNPNDDLNDFNFDSYIRSVDLFNQEFSQNSLVRLEQIMEIKYETWQQLTWLRQELPKDVETVQPQPRLSENPQTLNISRSTIPTLTPEMQKIFDEQKTKFEWLKNTFMWFKETCRLSFPIAVRMLPDGLKQKIWDLWWASSPLWFLEGFNKPILWIDIWPMISTFTSIYNSIIEQAWDLIFMFAPQELKDSLANIENFWNWLPEWLKQNDQFLKHIFWGWWSSDLQRLASILNWSQRQTWTDTNNWWIEWINKPNEFTQEQWDILKPKFSKFFKNSLWWFIWLWNDEKKWNDFFEDFWSWVMDKKSTFNWKKPFNEILRILDWDFGGLNIWNFFESIWFWTFVTIDFFMKWIKHWIFDVKNMVFELAENTWTVMLNSLLFFPKVLWFTIWKFNLEDFTNYLIDYEIPENQKIPILIMLYRALDSNIWMILKEIASLPFHWISAIANIWTDISKFGIAMESLFWNKIDKQLELLARIENVCLWSQSTQSWIFNTILETSLPNYRKWLVVSFAYSQTNSVNEFRAFLENFEVGWKKLFAPQELSVYLDDLVKQSWNAGFEFKWSTWWAYVWSVIEYYKARTQIPWNIKNELFSKIWQASKWIFSESNFLQSVDDVFWKSLSFMWEIMKKNDLLSKFWRPLLEIKSALEKSKSVDVLDLAKLTWNVNWWINWVWAFFDKIKILLKYSPEAAKFLFWEFPVILLWAEQMNKISQWLAKWDLNEAWLEFVKFFQYLIPIVWPITFLHENYDNLDYTWWAIWAIWLWFDTYRFIKSPIKSFTSAFDWIKNTWKILSQWSTMMFKLWKDVIDIWRLSMNWKANFLEDIWNLLRNSKWKWKMILTASIILWLWFLTKETIESYLEKEELAELMKFNDWPNDRWDLEWLENYIKQHWKDQDFDESEKCFVIQVMLTSWFLQIWDLESINVNYKDWKYTITIKNDKLLTEVENWQKILSWYMQDQIRKEETRIANVLWLQEWFEIEIEIGVW